MNDIMLTVQNNRPVVSSRQITESFEKRHDHVLRDIDTLKKDVPNFGEMFFETTEADAYGRNQRIYLMSRDGFALLAMGFTGKKALEWKVKYIEAFNKMEKELSQPKQLSRTELLSQALLIAHEELEESKKQVAALTEQNSYLTPRADYYDALCNQNLLTNFRDTAKELHIKEKDFINWLIDHGYIYRKGSKLRPYANKKNMHLFEVKDFKATSTNYAGQQTFITVEGKDLFRKELTKAEL
jgi:anti-repressor protein